MRRIITLISAFILLVSSTLRADEGMWIPILIEQFNIKLMQEKGFKLSAEDIYSVNKACMKDAVVILGGCTAELISPEGLVLTNHHCGYGRIQAHSTLEHDYLTNGFWAMSKEEELPNPGFTATFLKWMEDVTDKVLEGVNEDMDEEERMSIINAHINELTSEAVEGNDYTAFVRPFYMGNQYFLFVNETYRDVRLVGAPPSAIGKFGGETDNWIWPRHTGDFSMFRIYADKDNKPAEYSPDNVPFKPLYHLPISLKGVHEGDFTMVFGYPGSTAQYVPSYHISMLIDYQYPKMIDLRTRKLDIIMADMETDPLIRIQYSAKKSGIANSWKRWIGEKTGMEKLNTVGKKIEFEEGFTKWVESDEERTKMYGELLPAYKKLYEKYEVYNLVYSYSNETLGRSGVEAVSFAGNFAPLVSSMENGEPGDRMLRSIKSRGERFFKNYNRDTDKKLFVELMGLYGKNLDKEWWCDIYTDLFQSCNGDFSMIVDKLYSESIFTDKARFDKFISDPDKASIEKITEDPLYNLSVSVNNTLREKVIPELNSLRQSKSTLDRHYMKAQLEYVTDKVLWPDANRTLRVAYGNVAGYKARDAVYYKPYTTLEGIMEKDNPEIYDYNVPERLRELYRTKDYGRYAEDGKMHVCFIANNHTTGGNSGSPVINGEGQLIGINFDRAWEGVMSDLMFNPEQSRNISVDIRYILFLIDKFAGAGYLLDEMTLVE